MKFMHVLILLALSLSLFAGSVFSLSIEAHNLTEEYPTQIGIIFNESSNATDGNAKTINFTVNDTSKFQITNSGFFENITDLGLSSFLVNITLNYTNTNNVQLNVSKVILVNITDTTAPNIIAHNVTSENPVTVNVLFNFTDNYQTDTMSIDNADFLMNKTGSLTNTTALAAGTHTMTITANDTFGNTATLPVWVEITATAAPVITSNNIIEEDAHQIYEQFTATDVSGVDSWSLNGTSKFSIDNTGLLTNTSALATETTYPIQVAVNDTLNSTAFSNITVRIENSTNPSISIGNITIESNDTVSAQLAATDNVRIDSFKLADAYYVYNDSTNITEMGNFSVNSTGYLNSSTLVQGRAYWLVIEVNDTINNIASDTISITVTAPHATTTTTTVAATTVTTTTTSSTDNTDSTTTTTVSDTTTTTVLNSVDTSWDSLTANEQTDLDTSASGTCVKEVSIKPNADLTKGSIIIGEVTSPTNEVPNGNVYRYLEITAVNLTNDNITETLIKFEVVKLWLNENNLSADTVKLNRYVDGKWVTLETTKGEATDSYENYVAKSSGFSYFAITASMGEDDLLTGLFFSDNGEMGVGTYAIIVVIVIIVAGFILKNRLGSRGTNLSGPSIGRSRFSSAKGHVAKLKVHASKLKEKVSNVRKRNPQTQFRKV